MKIYLIPLAILVGAIIISITTYVALTKPQQDMIKKFAPKIVEGVEKLKKWSESI